METGNVRIEENVKSRKTVFSNRSRSPGNNVCGKEVQTIYDGKIIYTNDES